MYWVVGVRFKKAGKIYYFDPDKLSIGTGQHVIVETSRGIEYGEAVIANKQIAKDDLVLPLKKVLRIATDEDSQIVAENSRKAADALALCQEKVLQHNLDMKLVDVEYTFDSNKVIFYFTADGRIDFRELVKDLASIFRTRIELRQIGVRDEAKMIGGMGPCGRPLCCATFLGDFDPVSIRMAKDQNLSLNPAKISGICGRLMCCLKYESDSYDETTEELPDIGSYVMTSYGVGKVIGVNIIENTVRVSIDGGKIEELPLSEVGEIELT